MDIMELGAIGELVGGVAVIASLLFVGAQLRAQTREQRLAATRDLSAQASTVLAPLVEDPAFARLYRQGVQDLGSLEEDDRLRVGVFMTRVNRSLEQQFLHSLHSRVDPSYLEGMTTRMREGLAEPGVQQWWHLNSSAFSPEYQLHVNRLIEETKTGKRRA